MYIGVPSFVIERGCGGWLPWSFRLPRYLENAKELPFSVWRLNNFCNWFAAYHRIICLIIITHVPLLFTVKLVKTNISSVIKSKFWGTQFHPMSRLISWFVTNPAVLLMDWGMPCGRMHFLMFSEM